MVIAGVDYGIGESDTRLVVVDVFQQTVIASAKLDASNLLGCGQTIAKICRQHQVRNISVNTLGFGAGLLKALRQEGMTVTPINTSHKLP